jgi:hypothetical protein
VDFVARNCKPAASLSVISLVSFLASLAAIAAVGGGDEGTVGEIIIGCVMGVFLLSSFFAMVMSTIGVVRNRSRLVDWGMFLLFIWLVPYLGITFYVGVVAVRRMLRPASQRAASGE